MGLFSFLFGGSKQSDQQKLDTSNTQTRSPYGPAIPYINADLARTDRLYNTTPMFSPMEQQGYSALTRVANSGPSDFMKTATGELNATASGKYLTPDTNPYLADIAKRISGIAGSNAATAFGGRGRSGSGLAGYYSGKAVGDSLTDLYGSTYEQERQRQLAAASEAPSFEATRYIAPQALISAGQNVSARPFDLNAQRSGLINQIAGLGGTATSVGHSVGTGYKQSPGLFGQIINSFTNALFPGGSTGPW